MQPRRLAILAVLARAGARGVPRDTVLRLLWPDEDEERGRRVLSQAIYMLRRDLGSDDVIDGGRVLALKADEITSDVHEFERAIAERRPDDAVRAYEGPFLDGFTLASAPEFMRWVDDARDALALTFGQALEQAALAADKRNDATEAAALWKRRAGTEPLDGRIAKQLMEALERAGDRAGAIRHATIHAALVQQELGANVDAEVLALAESLKTRPLTQTFTTPKADPSQKSVAPATFDEAALRTAQEANRSGDRRQKDRRTPTESLPASATSAPGTPGHSTPVHGTPVHSTPVHSTPVHSTPVYSTPVHSTPVHSTHAGDSPLVGLAPHNHQISRTAQHRVAVKSAWRRGALAGGAALLAVIALLAVSQRGPSAPAPVARRVLVTPMANRTGDAALDPYGLMIAEWITQGLSRSGLVEVVDSRSMVETMRDAPAASANDEQNAAEHTRSIAARFNAGTVVSGTVYKDGDSLVVQVRVIEPATGRVLASVKPVHVSAAHATQALEPLRERVSGVLAILFDVRIGHVGATGSEPPTFDAYAEYLQGMQIFSRDFTGALPHFARAAQLDTSFRQAQLWMAMAMSNTRRYREADSIFSLLGNSRDRLAPYDAASLDYFHSGFVLGHWARSLEGAKRMRELAPQASHALYAEGLTSIFNMKPEEGLALLAKIDLTHGWGRDWAPRILSLRVRGHEMLGQYDEALALATQLRENDLTAGWQRVPELRVLARMHVARPLTLRLTEAMTLPPTSVGWEPFDPGDMLHQVAQSAAFVGDTQRAASLWKQAAAWYAANTAAAAPMPTRPALASQPVTPAMTVTMRRGHARVLFALGQMTQAELSYQALATSGAAIPEDIGMLGLIAFKLDRRDSALAISNRLEADTTSWRFGQPRTWAARLASMLGDSARSVQLLHRARREGFTRMQDIQLDPAFAPVRSFIGYHDFMAPYLVTDKTPGRTSRPRS